VQREKHEGTISGRGGAELRFIEENPLSDLIKEIIKISGLVAYTYSRPSCVHTLHVTERILCIQWPLALYTTGYTSDQLLGSVAIE
jgi:hypothetical protein